MDYVSKKIAAFLSNDNEEQEVVAYGIQAFISVIESIIIFIVTALITQDYYTVFWFSIFFVPLRVSVRGFHFDTALKCTVVSFISLLITIIALNQIAQFNVFPAIYYLITVSCLYLLHKENIKIILAYFVGLNIVFFSHLNIIHIMAVAVVLVTIANQSRKESKDEETNS